MRENCPDIDLKSGPRIIHDGTAQDGDFVEAAPPAHGGATHMEEENNIDPAIANDVQQTSEDCQPDRLAHEIGLVSVTGGQDPRYVVSSHAHWFITLTDILVRDRLVVTPLPN